MTTQGLITIAIAVVAGFFYSEPTRAAPAVDANSFHFPLEGAWAPITRFKWEPSEWWCGYHLGDDIARPAGTAIRPFARGTVRFASDVEGLGRAIILEHMIEGEPYISVYYHTVRTGLSGIVLNPGMVVEKETVIAHVTGESSDNGTGPHLHFGIRRGPYSEIPVGVKDPLTGKWFFPGYTSITGETTENGTCNLDNPIHTTIQLEWMLPQEFIESKQNVAQYLSFVEGDPGVPGDEVLVSSVGGQFDSWFELAPPMSLEDTTDGITLSFYPPSLEILYGVQVNFSVPGVPLTACSTGASGPDFPAPMINGVAGLAQYISQAVLETYAENMANNHPDDCGSITAQDLVVHSFVFFAEDSGLIEWVDAVAAGLGEDAFPESVP